MVECGRTQQGQRGDTLRIAGGETLPIGACTAGEMGSGDPQMAEELVKPSLDRRFFRCGGGSDGSSPEW
jgi:hypothetical protein